MCTLLHLRHVMTAYKSWKDTLEDIVFFSLEIIEKNIYGKPGESFSIEA